MSESFAPELIFLFLYRVFTGSNPQEVALTLRACCLVCQQWRDIAQPFIFSRYALFRNRYYNKKLIQSLYFNPSLAKDLGAVWLDDDWLYPDDFDNPTSLFLDNHAGTRVTHVGIYSQWPSEKLGSEDKVQRIYISALSSNNLTCLFIQDGRIPLYFLYLCPGLRELDLVDVEFSCFDEESGQAKLPNTIQAFSPRPQLDRFTIESDRGGMPILKWFMDPGCAFDISALKSFRAFDDSNDSQTHKLTLRFIQFVGPSLEYLAIDPPCQGDSDDGAYHSYECLTNLTSIRMTIYQGDLFFGEMHGIPLILDLLEHLPHPEKLETLILAFYFVPDRPYSTYIELGWGKLNKLLTDPSTPFRSFKEVVIRLQVWNVDVDHVIAKNALLEIFPTLHAKGMLTLVEKEEGRYPSRREPWIYYGPERD